MKFTYEIAPRKEPYWWINPGTDKLKYIFPFAIYWINEQGVRMLGAMIGPLTFTFAWKKKL